MDWLSVIPPLVAIIVVLWRKEVILALLLAVFSAELLLASQTQTNVIFYAFLGSIERVVATMTTFEVASMITHCVNRLCEAAEKGEQA